MGANKIVFNGKTLIDLTADTLSDASQLATGITALSKSGELITGTSNLQSSSDVQYVMYDSSTSDAITAGKVYIVKADNLICVCASYDFSTDKMPTSVHAGTKTFTIGQVPSDFYTPVIGSLGNTHGTVKFTKDSSGNTNLVLCSGPYFHDTSLGYIQSKNMGIYLFGPTESGPDLDVEERDYGKIQYKKIGNFVHADIGFSLASDYSSTYKWFEMLELDKDLLPGTEGLTAPGIVRSSSGLSPVRLKINDGMLYFHSIRTVDSKGTSGTVEGAIIAGHIVYPLSLGEKANLA